MKKVKPGVAIVLMLAVLQIAGCGEGAPEAKVEAATLEPVEGTDISRVILTADAAERLGIATAPLERAQVTRKRVFGAEVVNRPTGAPPGSGPWVRVSLTESELSAVDLKQPGLVFPLSGNDQDDSSGLTAEVTGSSIGDPEDPGGVYYTVTVASDLTPGTPVLVELPLAGTERLVVPYSAVVYDPIGQTWTYTNPEPLVFVRSPISIVFIDGGEAILSDGPPPGTEVVIVGSAELFGVESGVGA